jgi:hypothetical protein
MDVTELKTEATEIPTLAQAWVVTHRCTLIAVASLVVGLLLGHFVRL